MFKKIFKGLCFCAACCNIAHATCDNAQCTGDCSKHEKPASIEEGKEIAVSEVKAA